MDKISGIIPSSPRLQAVDLKDSAPVRPGTPTFGRPEGVSSLKVAAIPTFDVPTTAQRGMGAHQELMDWRSKDQRHAQMAAELSNRFFMKPDRTAQAQQQQQVDVTNGAGAYAGLPVGLVAVESRPTGFKTDELSAPRSTIRPPAPIVDEQDETTELQQPEGLFPKGSFLDRTV